MKYQVTSDSLKVFKLGLYKITSVKEQRKCVNLTANHENSMNCFVLEKELLKK